MDKITKSLDEGKIMAGMFLDLSKAFDTVNHGIYCFVSSMRMEFESVCIIS